MLKIIQIARKKAHESDTGGSLSNEISQHKIGRLASAMRMYVSAMRFMAGTIMGSIVVIMVVQVIARYVFNSSLIWAEELCRYLLIWMTFLLLGMSYRSGGLIAVDVVPLMLSIQARRVLRLMTTIPVLMFLAMMVWYGWDFASRFDNQTIPALDFISESLFSRPAGLSIRLVYISVPVGSGILGLHILFDFFKTLRALIQNQPDEPTAKMATGEL